MINGILLVNKPKGVTSRAVVNHVVRKLNIKKIGHTGTLDPLATGVLVLCIGRATKLAEKITAKDKEYLVTVQVGIETDTLDVTGKILKQKKDYSLSEDKLKETLNFFKGEYLQEVPKYSAVKVNGKRLYEYARAGLEVELPKKNVKIFSIELLDFNKDEFKFKVHVSKGTYIRSLIRDIGNKLSIPMCMKELVRTKQGEYLLEDCYTSEEIEKDKYKIIAIDLE